MAKESMITRTIKTTLANVLCLDIESGEACKRSFLIPREPKKEKEILAFVAKELATSEPTVHAVHVVDCQLMTELYGMSESKFLANAEKISRPVKK